MSDFVTSAGRNGTTPGSSLFPFRRWASVSVLTRNGEDLKERDLRCHFTERGARRWAESCVDQPMVLVKSMETALSGYGIVFADPAVRDLVTGQIVWRRRD